ncbi:MFS transporter [Staphylococcus coagulans]|uniref:MFS transporter n=1 Tax=Staphylococcus coagulans TaxID=74706 RepID=UPI001BEB880D|nr:MFS transporter [Staphylococcus coagulans]MBT2813371.1 MFS transporter [Staphylococcus coagulans]MBT2815634.1 MFS transporter [Staphylococcus coagulans]MBT2836977.1 MFS transporter [Staphylococcus coagulans]MBT2841505.1 MFS transporter [Staphylococcus coagulans]MBT2847596.1 MFS transporter [Staphylococcus coagulans]
MKTIYQLLIGRIATNIGDSIILISLTWYIATQYDNPVYLGIIGAIVGIIDVCMIFLGPILDRYHIKKILYLSTMIQIILVTLLALLFYSGHISLITMYILLSLSLIFSSLIYPAESVLIPKISKDEDEIMKNNSLFQLTYKGLNIILDSFIGFLLSVILIQNLISLNIFVFLIAFFMFKLLKVNIAHQNDHPNDQYKTFIAEYMEDFKEGLRYVSNKKILKLLLPLSFINFSISAVTVIYPKLALAYGHDSKIYAVLLFANGLGMMIGFLASPKVIKQFKFNKLLFLSFLILSIVWFIHYLFGTHSIIVCSILLFLSNFIIGIINLSFINAFQILPPKNMLGRVATTNETLLSILIPIGALVGGILPNIFNSMSINFILIAILSMAISLFYLLDKDIQRIEKLNLLK